MQDGGLNVHLIFSSTVVAFGLSFLYGWNIGVLNQARQVSSAHRSSGTRTQAGIEGFIPVSYTHLTLPTNREV